MAKFRKKPVVIEAQQWREPGTDGHDPAMLSHPSNARPIRLGDLYLAMRGGLPNVGGKNVYHIRTLEGDLMVSHGDWIITGIKGEKYPCKPDIFAATYEEVVETGPDARVC